MAKIKKGASRAMAQLACFFKQTFRRHTHDEYAEFVTRGVNRQDYFHRKYPWFYMRLFAACFILFAVFLLIVRFTSNELFSPSVILFAALAFNVPYLVLVYEVYPRGDLSLLKVFMTLLIGGTGACVGAQIFYAFWHNSNEWLLALYSGFAEEFSKALAVVIIIAVIRTKQPLIGFIMGVAVGCGFSIVEDMGYIFVYSNELPAINITTTITLFFDRGLTALCTHSLWTGAVGWAFCRFKRPLVNPIFYFVFASSFGLHALWNMPFAGVWKYVVTGFCIVVAVVFEIIVVYKGRKALFDDAGEQPTPEFFRSDEQSLKKNRQYYIHAGHLSLTIAAVMIAFTAIIYCAIPFRETYYTQTFSDKQEFISFMQDGYELSSEFDREYDENLPNSSSTSVDGVLTSVTQKVEEDGFTYYYAYNVVGDGNISFYFLTEVSVDITTATGEYRYFKEDLYDAKGRVYASYFRIRSDVTGFNMSADGEEITAFIYNPAFVMDYSQPQYAILFYVFAGIAVSALTTYIIFYIISRRIKDDVE